MSAPSSLQPSSRQQLPSSPEERKVVPDAGLAPPDADPTGTDEAVECPQKKIRPIIFCDLDGVLVDFNRGIYRLLRKDASKLYQTKSGIKRLWSAVSRSPKFFEKLHWTSDGRELWQSIYHLQPDILTGVPNSKPHDVGREKYRWCQRELTMPPKAPNKTRRGHEANKKVNENSQYNQNPPKVNNNQANIIYPSTQKKLSSEQISDFLLEFF